MSFNYNPHSQQVEQKQTSADNVATDVSFSAVDHNTIAWTNGIIAVSGGQTFSVNAGTADISGNTYIYFDGSATLQTTNDVKVAMSANNIMLGTAVDNVVGKKAMFKIDGNGGVGVYIDGDMIKAGSITVDELNFTPVQPGSGNNSVNANGIVTTIDGESILVNTITTAQLNFIPVQPGSGNNSVNASGYVTSIDGASIVTNSITASQIDTSTINIGSWAGTLDNIANGATYVKATAATISGAAKAEAALNASNRYKSWLVSTEMSVGTNPYTGLIQDSAGIRGYYQGVKNFEFATATGNGFFRGNIYATSGTFTGNITSSATITGGIIKTAASGARAEMSSSGFYIYDSSNYARVKITPGSAGSISLLGRKHGYYLESILSANIFQAGNAIGISGHLVVGLEADNTETNSGLVIPRNSSIYFLEELYDSSSFSQLKSSIYTTSGGDLAFQDRNGVQHIIVNI